MRNFFESMFQNPDALCRLLQPYYHTTFATNFFQRTGIYQPESGKQGERVYSDGKQDIFLCECGWGYSDPGGGLYYGDQQIFSGTARKKAEKGKGM